MRKRLLCTQKVFLLTFMYTKSRLEEISKNAKGGVKYDYGSSEVGNRKV